MSVYEFEVRTLDGRETDLTPYRNKVLLIVNTASQCGLTPQYEGLQRLYDSYAEQGLAVLGFPCNQFGAQEPGTSEEIGSFCRTNYGVTFPMFEKIEVNGPDEHPLYRYLKEQTPPPVESTDGEKDIRWNFTKFLVDREGRVADRIEPAVKPEEIEPRIRELLGIK
ncbi:glutathione peroxidase [Cohnella caldifontis]|uniref:glutathione peroxidase n=1 Tax=Cohnella caldifontis TaxID=3027471 RepID=UPI0023EDD929|nr:glutathione peroxidase [Cohnella sp. YIM B05605]